MTYPVLAAVFLFTFACGVFLTLGLISGVTLFSRKKLWIGYLVWLFVYGLFIFLGTGPSDLSVYPNQEMSPYKLPWQKGVERLVSQGNRSFTSHRGLHCHAWDFLMKNGTEVLATRDGEVVEVVDQFDGIGLKSNYIKILHDDGTKALYAHILKSSSKVKTQDRVKQGQLIALSGMVGQTIYPHLHFVVLNSRETESIPVSFAEVEGGVPVAGQFYTSQNSNLNSP